MREKILRTLHAPHIDERGQALTEYAKVAGLKARAGVSASRAVTGSIHHALRAVGAEFDISMR